MGSALEEDSRLHSSPSSACFESGRRFFLPKMEFPLQTEVIQAKEELCHLILPNASTELQSVSGWGPIFQPREPPKHK